MLPSDVSFIALAVHAFGIHGKTGTVVNHIDPVPNSGIAAW
jgi:hypothetical protein